MKHRIVLFLLPVLFFVALGGIFLFYYLPDRDPLQSFPATVDRDCAPWDGSAFTVKIPLNDGTMIDISIWRSPEIQFPVTFSFPDDSGHVGSALLIHPVGLPEQLTGTVFFWPADREHPVEGRFDLMDERGRPFKGQFKAEWGNFVAMCG